MRTHLAAIAALALVLLFGITCSDDDSGNGTDPEVVTLSDLVGTWTSTAWTFENRDTGEEIDMIENGFSALIVVEENGRYTLTLLQQDEVFEVDTGTLSIDGDVLIADSDDGDDDAVFALSMSGGTFEVMNPAEEFDFDGDQVDEPAILRITFARS